MASVRGLGILLVLGLPFSGCLSPSELSVPTPSEPEETTRDAFCSPYVLYLGADGWTRTAPTEPVRHLFGPSLGAVSFPALGIDGSVHLPAEVVQVEHEIGIHVVIYLQANIPAAGPSPIVPVYLTDLPIPLWFAVPLVPGFLYSAHNNMSFKDNGPLFQEGISVDASFYAQSGESTTGLELVSDPSVADHVDEGVQALSRIEVTPCPS